jgi:hypothetical protein
VLSNPLGVGCTKLSKIKKDNMPGHIRYLPVILLAYADGKSSMMAKTDPSMIPKEVVPK